MTAPTPDLDRRSALRAAGAAGVAAASGTSLAACGQTPSSVSSAASSIGAAASSAVSSAASAAADAIKAADIPVGGGRVFEAIKVVVTQPTAGDYKAFSAVCPHQGCLVTSVSDGNIVCPCHASTFDIATGEVTGGPAKTGLPAKGVSVGADGITVS